ncbi:hypothetical protein ACI2LC_17625 [Nonomuraea wenchangensis]|uniref:hypothetical protein n=1 Tax=Nonomuraea wenchangensis TaxID=568860 RepID=UPI0038501759
MADDRVPLTSAEVLDRTVFTLELAAGATAPDLAATAIRNSLISIGPRDLRRIVACLALNAVHAMPPAEVRAWIERLQLEHLMIMEARDDG